MVKKKSRGPTPKAEDRTWHKKYVKPTKGGASGARRPASPGVRSNSRSKDLRDKERRNENIIFGQNAVYEYLNSDTPAQKLIISSTVQVDSRIQAIVSAANSLGVQIFELPKVQLDQICGTQNHQGVVLYSQDYEYSSLESIISSGRTVVMLDHITDPHNLGAVIRSCAAFGADIIIPKARAAQVNATVWKVSAGNAMKVKIAQVPNLNTAIEKLQKAGYFVVGLDGDADIELMNGIVQDNKHICFVAGNEGSGIAALTRKNCDVLAKIETAVESLNVSNAVAVSLFSLTV
jgi:23S rRNA (guanosine2251-2'-O)-methyltransferase